MLVLPRRLPRAYLCEVITIDFPSAINLDNESHKFRRATGSIPLDGSSRKIKGGSPAKAIAVLSLRLFPPLKSKRLNVVINIFKLLVRHITIKLLYYKSSFYLRYQHCRKSVQMRSHFWFVFSFIRTEYRKIRTRNNTVFGHFSRSVLLSDSCTINYLFI